MQISNRAASLFILFATFFLFQCDSPTTPADSSNDGYLLLQEDGESSAYVNQKGETVIPAGKYIDMLTDTFRTYAMVLHDSLGYVVINRAGKLQYQVFNFDNGPDYPAEGLFRIVQAEKIGYADQATLEVVIPAQFDCAYPFENGQAKVSTDCEKQSDGEHVSWNSDTWHFIDKSGQKISED